MFISLKKFICSFFRKYSNKRSPSSTGDSSKFNSSSDTIVTNGVTPPQWKARSPQLVTIGMPQYGSASVNNIASSNASLIRSQPVMGIQSSTTMMRLPGHRLPPPATRSIAVRMPPDQASAYCTLNRHYEEIPVNYALPPSTATIPTSFSHNFTRASSRRFEEQPTQAMLFLDRLAQNVERKPPPSCRPPPPPESLNRSSASTDELDGSSLDAEIEVITRQHCSPINSRQSESGGCESGYNTGPSRLWHHQSPRVPPRILK